MNKNLKKFQEAKEQPKARDSSPGYVFRESRNYIEASMGIELTLIELVRLRELAIESIDRNSKVKGHWSRANPINDTTEIFLHDYYGVPLSRGGVYGFLIGRQEFREKNGYDGYREFWKKRQNESHKP